MKLKPFKLAPGLIAFGVICFFCLLRVLPPELTERLERMTFDIRSRQAARLHPSVATNLGFVFINEDSISWVQTNKSFGYGLYWPRTVYGRLVRELADQGARLVALDVVFAELRQDQPSVRMADGTNFMESDDFFAQHLRLAGNVILPTTQEKPLPILFATNALALAAIGTEPDVDGILRRARAFQIFTNWHPAFRMVEADAGYGVDLNRARIEPHQVVLPRLEGEEIKIPLDQEGNFEVADFWGEKLPAGVPRKAKPLITERYWQMGIVMGAQALGLDLEHARVDLAHGQIVLSGTAGLQRIIPVDQEGFLYIDWCLPPEHSQVRKESIQDLLAQSTKRLQGDTVSLTNRWRGRLAVLGSAAVVGNDLRDHGATPLAKDTFFASKHWNIANSVLTGRFVQRSPFFVDLALIVILGGLSAFFSWGFKVLQASLLVALLVIGYVVAATILYIQMRYWIPIALPVAGAAASEYVALVTWRVVFEQANSRRIKSIFSKVVSHKIVKELLEAENLSLVGARREITVLFADVRGFTAFTDLGQERVKQYVQEKGLTGAEAESCYNEQARETLETVNLYLGLIADVIKKNDGTLDKFIGDCVMAFWGAPTPNPKHAAACVRAAIEAQRAMFEINQQRVTENNRRQLENLARISAGLPPKPPQAILLLGTGINTGVATAGLMGSSDAESNYTVFGREVNLASRLESASGRGHIYIGETTYLHLLRDDPELAGTCIELPPTDLKGFRAAVKVYEVPWRAPGSPPFDEEFSATAPTDATSFTGFVQRGS